MRGPPVLHRPTPERPVRRLPLVPQLAELQEYRLRIGMLADVGEALAQARDDRGALQAQERVDALLLPEGRHRCSSRILVAATREERGRLHVAGLAIEREFEV